MDTVAMTTRNPGMSASKIQCKGGPKEGTYKYGNPLPKAVVFVDLNAGLDEVYLRKDHTAVYEYAAAIPRGHYDH
jgi:hypothetical protein